MTVTDLAAERAHRLTVIIAAEQAIEAEARGRFAALLAAIAKDVLGHGPNHVDLTQNRNQINELWLGLLMRVTIPAANLFKSRFLGTGAPRVRLASASEAFVGNVTKRLSGVPSEVYAVLSATRDELLRNGASETEIEASLSREITPGNAEYEARVDSVASRMARTTAIAAFNAGDQAGFAAIAEHDKVPMATKRWLSSHDARVRPTHAEADADPANQQVPGDGNFTVGGFQALYPGDPNLPASESVNCRCTALYTDPNGTLVTDLANGDAVPENIVAAAAGLPNGFRGPIAALDVPTGDRRQLQTPEGGIKTREYPLSLTMNHVGDPTGYPVIGHLDRVWAQEGLLWGEGPFDLGGESGREAARQLHEGHMNTVSIDPDMVVAAVNTYDSEGNLISSDQLSAEESEHFRLAKGAFSIDQLRTLRGQLCEDMAEEEPNTYVLAFTDWRLAGLAMVPIPAYTQARIEPVYDYVASSPMAGDAIVSAVGGQIFHKEFFGNPKFTQYTPPTIDENGHFYGHVREHGTCYQYGGGAGDGGFCLEPPDSACGYAKFEQHGAKMDDGSIARVGAITFGDGHESRGSLKASQKHYNDVSTICAKANAGTDEFGVWVNGEIVAAFRETAYDIMLAPYSGHWEPDADNNGYLEMMAVHFVVTPGYRTRRIVAGFDDAGQPNSLIITTYPNEAAAPDAPAAAPAPLSRAAVVAAINDLNRAAALSHRIKLDTQDAVDRRVARALARIGRLTT